MLSIWELELILGTLFVSIRCCHAPEPIDSKPVWEVPLVNLKVRLPECTLEKSYSPSDVRRIRLSMPLKLLEELRTSSLVYRRLLFPTNGDSPNSRNPNISSYNLRVNSSQMVPMFSSSLLMVPFPDFPSSRNPTIEKTKAITIEYNNLSMII